MAARCASRFPAPLLLLALLGASFAACTAAIPAGTRRPESDDEGPARFATLPTSHDWARVTAALRSGSVSQLLGCIRDAKRRRLALRTGYLEAYLFRIQQRAYPRDRVDWSAYPRAQAHRDRMPAAVIRDRLGRALPQRWEYVGPFDLDVPFRQFFGKRPTSGRVNDLAYDPIVPSVHWLASASGGVFKSVDSGQTWRFLSHDWPFLETSCVAIHPTNPNVVYVGTGDFHGFGTYGFGVMKTADGGNTWVNLGRTQFGGAAVARVLLDPDSPDLVTVATGRGRVGPGRLWRSTNGGATWALVSGLPAAEWSNVVVSARPSQGTARWYYAVGHAPGGEVWRSADRGLTWTKLQPPLGSGFQVGLDIATSPTAPDTVYLLSGTDRKIYKSTNAGNTWSDITGNFPHHLDPNANGGQGDFYNWSQAYYDYHIRCSTRLDASQNPQDVVYVGLIDLVQSVDAGATWRSVGLSYQPTAETHNDQHCMAFHPRNPSEALVGNDGGVYRFTYQPGNDTWSFNGGLNRLMSITQFYTGDFHPSGHTVRIELSRNGGADWETLSASTENDGVQTWIVAGPATAQARVRVTAVTLPAFSDISDAPFTIREPATLTVVSPNGGELLGVGQAVPIRWSGVGFAGRVAIDFSTDGGSTWSRVFGNTANDGEETWRVPARPTTAGRIRVLSLLAPEASDISDGLFIVQPVSLQVLEPAAGAQLPVGALAPVRWSSSGLTSGASVRIELSTDGGRNWSVLAAAAPNTGSFAWTVAGPPTRTARIRLTHPATGGGPVTRAFSGSFRIVAPTLRVTQPAAGDRVSVGAEVIVRWAGTAVGHGRVDVLLSRDGGQTWETLAAGTPDDGALAWGVTGPASSRSRIRVVWSENRAVVGESGPFTIS